MTHFENQVDRERAPIRPSPAVSLGECAEDLNRVPGYTFSYHRGV
jgi:hypothetical protein